MKFPPLLRLLAAAALMSCGSPTPDVPVEAISAAPATEAWVLQDVRVVDVERGAVRVGQSLLIEAGVIRAVGASGSLEVPAGARTVDGGGRWVTPGLWDMHVHALASWETAFPLFLANGVTGIRNLHTTLEDPVGVVLELKAGLADGSIRGPLLVANGPIVDGPQPIWPSSVAVADAEAGREAVRTLHARGMDFIKVYELLPREAYFAVMDEAARLGIPVDGHVPEGLTVLELADAGQRCIEHFRCVVEAATADELGVRALLHAFFAAMDARDPRAMDEAMRTYLEAVVEQQDPQVAAALFARMAELGTWICPTGVLYTAEIYAIDPQTGEPNPDFRYVPAATRGGWLGRARAMQELARADEARDELRGRFEALSNALLLQAVEAGVPVLAGTDVGNPFLVEGFSLLDELERMQGAGLTPLTVLQTATLNPARMLMRDDVGLVAVGRRADLLLLDADPLEDVAALRELHAVVLGGEVVDRAELDAMLLEVERQFAEGAD